MPDDTIKSENVPSTNTTLARETGRNGGKLLDLNSPLVVDKVAVMVCAVAPCTFTFKHKIDKHSLAQEDYTVIIENLNEAWDFITPMEDVEIVAGKAIAVFE